MGPPPRQGVYDITIKHLMFPNVKQWDVRVIRELFCNAAAEDIWQVPLVEEVVEDKTI